MQMYYNRKSFILEFHYRDHVRRLDYILLTIIKGHKINVLSDNPSEGEQIRGSTKCPAGEDPSAAELKHELHLEAGGRRPEYQRIQKVIDENLYLA